MTNHICTVGHSTRDFEEILELCRNNGVTYLVDVRSFPSSRKFPHWNQEAIIAALPADIGYRWIQKLGGRRHTPAGVPSVNNAWRVKGFRDYADYMAGDAFEEGLGELLEIARRERPAIMCSEAVPWRCHRRLITDALIVKGVEVVHIISRTSAKPAVLNPTAQIHNGNLTYPARP
ncbi:DUF488 family protein [[Kitasatospora] papulosa]|uniref:DUF488 domain-containing protein n=1 Tax=[Kitasatospora] papulosa TaxID=1464011 RepID=UPI0038279E5C